MAEEIYYTKKWLEQVKIVAKCQYAESRRLAMARYHQQLVDLQEYCAVTIAVAQEAYDKAQKQRALTGGIDG